jgi:long-subunit acyl-CoA synthetase (AMP-forming)
MHSFGNFSHAALGLMSIREPEKGERILSYLPLAHAAERMGTEILSFYTGCQVYFVYSLDTFIEDLRRARPTAFFGVPRIWLKFQEQIFQQSSKRKINLLLKTPIISRVVQRKIRVALGLDQATRFVSGASPISTALLQWYSSVGIHIREGYGMTENLAYSHFSTETSFKIGAVGKTTPGVSAKIGEEGEVLVKSPATMLGYYKDTAATQAAITADGYLRTGDKGQIDSDGFLKITGRIKECFKTTKGKYIAPAPIEALVMQYNEIDNVCVMGTGLPQPIALIVLSELGRLLPMQQLVELLAGMKLTMNSQLDAHERLQCFVVLPAIWSIESGELTPTLKVKRSVIEDKYSDRYQQWHDANQDVIVL